MTRKSKISTALFAGSFNPFTIGHKSIVDRALQIFDKIVIAIGYNEQKGGLENAESNAARIRDIFKGYNNIEVAIYKGLTVDFAKSIGADSLLRGVRSVADFEYERNLADINRRLSGIETILLFSLPEFSCISSSMVRELMHNGVDVSPYLPSPLK